MTPTTPQVTNPFEDVDDADNKQETVDRIEQENKPVSDQPPATTALNELAQGESLSEVLTVALKEWREMQQISRQRAESEYAFQQSVIRIGVIAFGNLLFEGKNKYTRWLGPELVHSF